MKHLYKNPQAEIRQKSKRSTRNRDRLSSKTYIEANVFMRKLLMRREAKYKNTHFSSVFSHICEHYIFILQLPSFWIFQKFFRKIYS